MGILVITVDLECCRCKSKITKVLDCLKAEFSVEKVELEDKSNKVVVRGKYDAEKLCKKVWSKAGKFVKEIVIAEVWPMPPPPKPCEPDHCKPCKPKPAKCDCDHCCKPCKEKTVKCEWVCKPEPKPKPKPEPKPEPKPKIEYKLVPYPYPMICPSWPRQCPPQQLCHCHTPPAPAPPPPPSSCSCPNQGNCSCRGTPSVWGPQPPVWWPPQQPVWPPPWGAYNVVTEEASCSVM